MNRLSFNTVTRAVSALSNVQVSFNYKCECGNEIQGTMEWPENLNVNGSVIVGNEKCHVCHDPVILPKAHYYVDGFRLLSKPLDD